IEYQVYQHYVNHTAPFFLRPLLNIDVAKLKYWERYYWRQADRVIAVSAHDRNIMRNLEPDLKVEIVPNGVNLDLFKKKASWHNPSPTILFVGNFLWLQNTEAAIMLIDQILPLVNKKIPKARVVIAGQHQPEELVKRASDKVKIVNLKEDDVQGLINAYYQADIFASPIKGPGGTRLKNLAAMASLLPIVSSSVGVRGLGVVDGDHVYVRNSPSGQASAIISLLTQPNEAERLARKARAFVQDKYDYAIVAKKLSRIYQSLKRS
ncbi:glycosyltransferase family 4 protein, partial [Candidatus Collierbacteria bacterium]|nr:glycosyltransferase family 4 protein [Candidatus Collierbacteria bacterium]